MNGRWMIDIGPRIANGFRMVLRPLWRVIAVCAFAGYGLTGIVLLEPGEQGLRFFLGRPAPELLGPGLHIVGPRPFARVKKYPTGQLVEITTSAAVTRPPGTASRGSAVTNEDPAFLVGAGTESVSITGVLRVARGDTTRDLRDHDRITRDPIGLVSRLYARVLTQETLASSIDRLMTQDAATLGTRVREGLNRELARFPLGLTIVSVETIGISPPRAVMDAYGEVINAKVDADRQVAESHGFAVMESIRSQMMRDTIIADAAASVHGRVAEARSSSVFVHMLTRYERPVGDLVRHHLFASIIADALTSKPLTVVSSSLPSDTHIWFADPDSKRGTP